MSRPDIRPRVTNAPNSHPGHVRTTPFANPQLSPVLTKWHGYDVVSLLSQDIFLVDPDTKVRSFRIPTSGLTYEVPCLAVPRSNAEDQPASSCLLPAPNDADQYFARLYCALPTLDPEVGQDIIYVVSGETFGRILVACHLHHTPLSLRLAVPAQAVCDTSGATLGYGTLVVFDQLADAQREEELPEQARLFA